MVRAIATFMDFCYIVRREVLDDNDINKLKELISKFHEEREIFRATGVRNGFCLPRQHSLVHYPTLIHEFGVPNGLCSSITESKHIKAVKEPWRRSNRFNALSQMLLTNQRLDKLAAMRVEFQTRGMLSHVAPINVDAPPDPPAKPQGDDDGGEVNGIDILAEVRLARRPSKWILNMLTSAYVFTKVPNIPRKIVALSQHLGIPQLSVLISRFLYAQENPTDGRAFEDMPLEECPRYTGKIRVYPSAIATYRAPSDLSGSSSMRYERIRCVSSWWDGPPRKDCVFIEQHSNLAGFRGLFIGQIESFISLKHNKINYPCAVISTFSPIADSPCRDTGMWIVERDLDDNGENQTMIVHIDTIIRSAHLIGIAGNSFIPKNLRYSDSLDAFRTFYVNKFIDYHAHEIAF
jgi:hypothetical protein